MTETQEAAARLVDQIKPLLAGVAPGIQGAALADCLALWLASHYIPGNENSTRTMRAELLANHCSFVRELVPIHARMMGTTP